MGKEIKIYIRLVMGFPPIESLAYMLGKATLCLSFMHCRRIE